MLLTGELTNNGDFPCNDVIKQPSCDVVSVELARPNSPVFLKLTSFTVLSSLMVTSFEVTNFSSKVSLFVALLLGLISSFFLFSVLHFLSPASTFLFPESNFLFPGFLFSVSHFLFSVSCFLFLELHFLSLGEGTYSKSLSLHSVELPLEIVKTTMFSSAAKWLTEGDDFTLEGEGEIFVLGLWEVILLVSISLLGTWCERKVFFASTLSSKDVAFFFCFPRGGDDDILGVLLRADREDNGLLFARIELSPFSLLVADLSFLPSPLQESKGLLSSMSTIFLAPLGKDIDRPGISTTDCEGVSLPLTMSMSSPTQVGLRLTTDMDGKMCPSLEAAITRGFLLVGVVFDPESSS
jgi:hypothetical protein